MTAHLLKHFLYLFWFFGDLYSGWYLTLALQIGVKDCFFVFIMALQIQSFGVLGMENLTFLHILKNHFISQTFFFTFFLLFGFVFNSTSCEYLFSPLYIRFFVQERMT